MFMTNKKMLQMTQEVIDTYAADILNQLGLGADNDGILSRISVSDMVGDELPNAVFNHVTSFKRSAIFSLSETDHKYQIGSGNIVMYPMMNTMIRKKKGGLTRLPAVTLLATIMHKQFKNQLIFQLAHELRHYWQFYTGEVFKHDIMRGGENFMPYEWRWEEKDANKFAAQYVKGMN